MILTFITITAGAAVGAGSLALITSLWPKRPVPPMPRPAFAGNEIEGNRNVQGNGNVIHNYAAPEFKTDMERHLHGTIQQLLQHLMQKDRELSQAREELHRLKLEQASKHLPLYKLMPEEQGTPEAREPRNGRVSIYPRQKVAV